uniref:DUF4959 domain-containing protein n=1 Tax=Prevotella sp. TaxID=59823 RepID=UPI004025A6A3
MKYTLLYMATAALTLMSMASCKSDDDNTFGVTPTGGVTFHAVPGGAVMNYKLPSNADIKDIRVRYTDAQGKENIVLGSYLCDSLSLGGFNGATQNVPAYVSYIASNGDISDEYATSFSTADSGPYAFFEHAEVKSAWNGFELSYDIPDSRMKGLAHVFFVGKNPNTNETDTLLLGSVTLAKGKTSKFFRVKQDVSSTTVVIKTEDFGGYFVKQQKWEGIKAYPTQQLAPGDMTLTCSKSIEDDTHKLGLQYLTDGDLKGVKALAGSYSEYYTFAMGPYAFGTPIIVDMKEQKVPAAVRIYTQLMTKEGYYQPAWNGMSWTSLPCEVTVYGSNDKTLWTQLGHYEESDVFSDNSWFNVNHTVQRMNKLTTSEMDEAEPVYMEVTCPISEQTFRYLKVVPNKSFSYDIPMFANTSEYIYMQEMEVYTKK